MKDKQEQGLQDSLGDRTVLVIDDSEAVRTALDVLLSMHGARVVAADSAVGRARRARARAGRPRHPGHELPPRGDLRRGGHRALPPDPRAVPGPAGHPADGLDSSRDGGRIGEGGRRRLRREALGQRAAPDDRAEPARPARGARREPRDPPPPRTRAQRARFALRPEGAGLRERGDARARLDGRARRACRRAGADHRPERRRQGSDRRRRCRRTRPSSPART